VSTLLQDIQAALVALAPNGRSANFAWNMVNTAEPAVYPYVIFQRVISTDNNTLSGPTSLQNTRIQVDVIDRQAGAADALATQVRTALLAAFSTFPQACVPLTTFDAYEDAVKAFRVSADYSIWATN
jgi:hypothetical protein